LELHINYFKCCLLLFLSQFSCVREIPFQADSQQFDIFINAVSSTEKNLIYIYPLYSNKNNDNFNSTEMFINNNALRKIVIYDSLRGFNTDVYNIISKNAFEYELSHHESTLNLTGSFKNISFKARTNIPNKFKINSIKFHNTDDRINSLTINFEKLTNNLVRYRVNIFDTTSFHFFGYSDWKMIDLSKKKEASIEIERFFNKSTVFMLQTQVINDDYLEFLEGIELQKNTSNFYNLLTQAYLQNIPFNIKGAPGFFSIYRDTTITAYYDEISE
jgi:hypothetical protein